MGLLDSLVGGCKMLSFGAVESHGVGVVLSGEDEGVGGLGGGGRDDGG